MKPPYKLGNNKEVRKSKQLLIHGLYISVMPCPFCGGTDLTFDYLMKYRNGDCGFDRARIECKDCSGAKGNGSNYGNPTAQDELNAWEKWNERH